MPQKKVQLREVAGFIDTLEESGARNVERGTVDPRGLVEVRWTLPQVEKERRAAVERAEYTAILFSAAFAVVVIVALLVSLL